MTSAGVNARRAQTDAEKLTLAKARLLGRSIIQKVKARNGLDAFRVTRCDGEVREFCWDLTSKHLDQQNFMFTMAGAFAGPGAKIDF